MWKHQITHVVRNLRAWISIEKWDIVKMVSFSCGMCVFLSTGLSHQLDKNQNCWSLLRPTSVMFSTVKINFLKKEKKKTYSLWWPLSNGEKLPVNSASIVLLLWFSAFHKYSSPLISLGKSESPLLQNLPCEFTTRE